MIRTFNPIRTLSIESLPLLSNMLVIGLMVVTVILVYQLLRPWLAKSRSLRGASNETIPDTMMVQSRQLMNKQEVTLFNLLHLVIRESYLLLAKVPLRALLYVSAEDESARRALLKSIRTILVDFVLVHPGTLLPVKVIMVESEGGDHHLSHGQEHMMEAMFREVDVEMIRLKANTNYSTEQLRELLGLQEEE